MDLNALNSAITKYAEKFAFVVGNGINLYGSSNANHDWKKTLVNIWNEYFDSHINPNNKELFRDISLTEMYDVLSLQTVEADDVKKEFLMRISGVTRSQYNEALQQKFEELGRPVITLNYDNLIESGLKKYKMTDGTKEGRNFTDYYPWNIYYAHNVLVDNDPTKGFGVWHINGMFEYQRSIKLGLSDYTLMASRAKNYIHSKESPIDTFDGKNTNYWSGMTTWLHLIFNCDLVIFGLGLEKDETFLRWLLIERAKYFDRFHLRRHAAYYVCRNQDIKAGKRLFLESIGIEVVAADNYDDVYVNLLNVYYPR